MDQNNLQKLKEFISTKSELFSSQSEFFGINSDSKYFNLFVRYIFNEKGNQQKIPTNISYKNFLTWIKENNGLSEPLLKNFESKLNEFKRRGIIREEESNRSENTFYKFALIISDLGILAKPKSQSSVLYKSFLREINRGFFDEKRGIPQRKGEEGLEVSLSSSPKSLKGQKKISQLKSKNSQGYPPFSTYEGLAGGYSKKETEGEREGEGKHEEMNKKIQEKEKKEEKDQPETENLDTEEPDTISTESELESELESEPESEPESEKTLLENLVEPRSKKKKEESESEILGTEQVPKFEEGEEEITKDDAHPEKQKELQGQREGQREEQRGRDAIIQEKSVFGDSSYIIPMALEDGTRRRVSQQKMRRISDAQGLNQEQEEMSKESPFESAPFIPINSRRRMRSKKNKGRILAWLAGAGGSGIIGKTAVGATLTTTVNLEFPENTIIFIDIIKNFLF